MSLRGKADRKYLRPFRRTVDDRPHLFADIFYDYLYDGIAECNQGLASGRFLRRLHQTYGAGNYR